MINGEYCCMSSYSLVCPSIRIAIVGFLSPSILRELSACTQRIWYSHFKVPRRQWGVERQLRRWPSDPEPQIWSWCPHRAEEFCLQGLPSQRCCAWRVAWAAKAALLWSLVTSDVCPWCWGKWAQTKAFHRMQNSQHCFALYLTIHKTVLQITGGSDRISLYFFEFPFLSYTQIYLSGYSWNSFRIYRETDPCSIHVDCTIFVETV